MAIERSLNGEMIKLRELLDAHGIKWRDASEPDDLYSIHGIDIEPMQRTHFEIADQSASVIFGYGSYGYTKGLLEAYMPNDDEPQACLSAQEIVDAWIAEVQR